MAILQVVLSFQELFSANKFICNELAIYSHNLSTCLSKTEEID